MWSKNRGALGQLLFGSNEVSHLSGCNQVASLPCSGRGWLSLVTAINWWAYQSFNGDLLKATFLERGSQLLAGKCCWNTCSYRKIANRCLAAWKEELTRLLLQRNSQTAVNLWLHITTCIPCWVTLVEVRSWCVLHWNNRMSGVRLRLRSILRGMLPIVLQRAASTHCHVSIQSSCYKIQGFPNRQRQTHPIFANWNQRPTLLLTLNSSMFRCRPPVLTNKYS